MKFNEALNLKRAVENNKISIHYNGIYVYVGDGGLLKLGLKYTLEDELLHQLNERVKESFRAREYIIEARKLSTYSRPNTMSFKQIRTSVEINALNQVDAFVSTHLHKFPEKARIFRPLHSHHVDVVSYNLSVLEDGCFAMETWVI